MDGDRKDWHTVRQDVGGPIERDLCLWGYTGLVAKVELFVAAVQFAANVVESAEMVFDQFGAFAADVIDVFDVFDVIEWLETEILFVRALAS